MHDLVHRISILRPDIRSPRAWTMAARPTTLRLDDRPSSSNGHGPVLIFANLCRTDGHLTGPSSILPI
jgi:hypothetical protein